MEDVLDNVDVKAKTGKYGDVTRKGANNLYKSYVQWTLQNRPDSTPMKFPEWAEWAQHKGVIKKRMSADGDGVVKPDVTPIVASISRTGKIVAWSIIGVTAVSLLYYMFKPVVSANPNVPAAPIV